MTDLSVEPVAPTPGTKALPEPTWLWRRIVTFAAGAITFALLTFIVWKLAALGATASLAMIATLLICSNAWVFTVYTVAPSVEYVKAIGALIKDAKS